MDSHTFSASNRLEVVDTGRRRRWSEDEKARIVLESLAGPRLVSVVARRYNISRSLLVTWRRAFKVGQSEASMPAFVPAIIAEPATKAPKDVAATPSRIEIVLRHDRRVIVDADVDPDALSRVLDVLDRR